MAIIVQKYGGSSVATVDRLKQVARKVVQRRRSGDDVVVVVSAMGDTTDRLLEMARQMSSAPHRRELDMLLTVGERTSMALLSMAIHDAGVDAISFTGSQCGILTTDSHSRAQIMEVRPFRVQDELARGRVVIVAGYQGTSYKREITTLGRGGSDLTAVALAGALGAEACEIYSDVDGVWTADPRIVPSSTKIESLSYEEMEALSRGGAKVLNRDAVAWARRVGVALYARSTFAPDDARGTAVRLNPPVRPNPVIGVTGRKDWIRVQHTQASVLSDLLCGSPVVRRRAKSDLVTAWLVKEDLPEASVLIEGCRAAGATVEEHLGSVTVVGTGLGENQHTYQLLVSQLSEWPNELTETSWTAWLPPDLVDQTVRIVHDAALARR